MKKNYLSLIVFFAATFIVSAQSSEETFTPSGKPIVKVFNNFNHTISDGAGHSAFEVERAYFGYDHKFSKEFSGIVLFDVANKGGLEFSDYAVFVKNAYAKYSTNFISAEAGLIGTSIFKLQESLWGKRYMYKSFQDEYKFGSSADLGAKVTVKIIPQVSLDVSVLNGEGYKKVESDSVLQVAAGLTIEPIKNLYVRIYADYMEKDAVQNTINAFVGYKCKIGSIGAEYNLQNGNKMTAGNDMYGISGYGSLNFAKKFAALARVDYLSSTGGWNSNDGIVYIGGIEYTPVKGIQITPNFRYEELSNGDATTGIYLNLGLSL